MSYRLLLPALVVGSAVWPVGVPPAVRADDFVPYVVARSFELPQYSVFDCLPDGRMVVLHFADVYVESSAGTGSFVLHGVLPDADMPEPSGWWGAAFVRASPDGTKLAVGNYGGATWSNYEVAVFDFPAPDGGWTTGEWLAIDHFDAAWYDNTRLAISAEHDGSSSIVTIWDVTTGTNETVIAGIGGASAGITFDAAGNLYTGNGYQYGGPSGTGQIKAFENSAWVSALDQGSPLDFETTGTEIVDILSAASLGFDIAGNLHVGGGEATGEGSTDFAAVIKASAVSQAAAGQGEVLADDTTVVARLNPGPASDDFYAVGHNPAVPEVYLLAYADTTVYVFAPPPPIPAASEWGLVVMALSLLTAGSVAIRRCRRGHGIADRFLTFRSTPLAPGRGSHVSLTQTYRVTGILVVGAWASVVRGESPFAADWVEYAPAPGQFVQAPNFTDPGKALGAPSGGGTFEPDHRSKVTLGGFGGVITLKFDHVVEDDPLNPFGLDAIVFGNAHWVDGDPNRHWAECATIEIALDSDGNGEIEEEEGWYLIPGAHIPDAVAQYRMQMWDDDEDTAIPPEDLSWVPLDCSGSWTTGAYELPADLFAQRVVENPSGDPEVEGIFGYAEYSPTLLLGDLDADNEIEDPLITPEKFYTVPDDPFTVGITRGSGGGDAFDIAWAIDAETGLPAGLPGFDLIRLTNPTDAVLPFFNEKSPEIDAVADVAPDPFGDCDDDGDIDLSDLACLQVCFGDSPSEVDPCGRMDRGGDELIDLGDAAAVVARLMGPR